MSKRKNKYLDFSDYFNDEEKVSKEDTSKTKKRLNPVWIKPLLYM